MSDNKDYWKELLGDDFNSDLLSDLDEFSSTGTGKPSGQPEPDDPDVTRVVRREAPERPADRPPEVRPVSAPAANGGDDDFQINFDFEKEYGDAAEEKEPVVKRRREKRTGCLGGFFYFAFVLGISILLACVGWMAATDVLGLSSVDSEVEVTIPKNYEMDDVVDMLYENGLIQYKSLFKLYSKVSHADEKIQSGTYILNTNYDYRALVYGMTPSEGKRVEVSVTIPEGYSLQQIIDLLVENKVCEEEDLWDAAANYRYEDYDFLGARTLGQKYRMEGFLFPDTYTFYVGDSPSRVFDKMLSNFSNQWTEEYQTQADLLGYSMEDIIKVASIIEKEAAGSSDRALIASVIYNRVENPDASPAGYLGLDSTVYYACAVNGVPFSIEVDSPYNTYTHQGLPAGPISNPGIAAIEAALYPEDTAYYYFALAVDGEHRFFETYYGFEEFVNSDEFASE